MYKWFIETTRLKQGFILFIGILIMVSIFGIVEAVMTDEPLQAKNHELRETEVEKVDPDKVEKAEKVDHTDLSENNIEYLHEFYQMTMDKYGSMIIAIEPRTDDYKEINVILDENVFNLFDAEDKQIFIDSVGTDIEGSTRSIIYKTKATDFLLVYFVNENGEDIVQTETFEKAWEVY